MTTETGQKLKDMMHVGRALCPYKKDNWKRNGWIVGFARGKDSRVLPPRVDSELDESRFIRQGMNARDNLELTFNL